MRTEKLHIFLDQLQGEKITCIRREAIRLWIGIGDTIENLNNNDLPIRKAKMVICIQCAWKIVDNEQKKIIVASSDAFSPKNVIVQEKFNHDDFDWNAEGNNLCDEKLQNWLETRSPIYMKEYNINRFGDLQIILSNDEQLKIFINASDYTEAWRIFSFHGGKQLVFSGLGYEFL